MHIHNWFVFGTAVALLLGAAWAFYQGDHRQGIVYLAFATANATLSTS
jgi:TRAP-type mannitol/chloroaromatic compound transport system permease small subunit